MITRIIPLSLFLLISTLGFAQMPTATTFDDLGQNPTLNSSFVCPLGTVPDAGTSMQVPGITNMAINTVANEYFLCSGDSLYITHQGGDLSGDPNPGTAPGFAYAFYQCLPTISGTDFPTVKTDPCNFTNPDPGPNSLFVTNQGFEPSGNGNGVIVNNGVVQNFFNDGGAVRIWFAPITMDDYATQGFELGGGINGPCINVNTADAFSVAYLNPITFEEVNGNAGANGCSATMKLRGGLSELDGSNYGIDIFLVSDPSVKALHPSAYNHYQDNADSIFIFSAPVPGLYRAVISDDVGCSSSMDFDMSACTEVVFNLENVFATPGSNVCLDLTIEDFTDVFSFQFTMEWDATLLDFTGINNGALATNTLNWGPPTPNNFIIVSAQTAPLPTPLTFADGEVLYQICFDVLGSLGDDTPVEITSQFITVEVTHELRNSQIAYIINQGSVTISNVNVDLTSCATTSTLSTGSFTMVANGGTAPYTYDWEEIGNTTNNGSGNLSLGIPEEVSPLAPANYSVTVTDNLGVAQVETIEVVDNIPLGVQTGFQNPTCSTDSDGVVTITASGGGVAPYSFLWSTGSTDPMMISGLPIGTYSVTITDNMGCKVPGTQTLFSTPVVLDTVGLPTHVTCGGGGMDGAVTVVATGGVAGSTYNYTWDNGGSGPTITGLAAGTYCVTATDDNMCPDVMCIDINAPILPVITSFDSISVTCPNDLNGQLIVHATPGNVPISNYQWDPNPSGSVDSILNNIPAGTYYVTVTADDGCMAVDSATLYAPPALSVTVNATPPTCPDQEPPTGQISLVASGGSGTYSYLWDNGTTINPLTTLPCGRSYSYTITESSNCDFIIDSVFLDCPPSIGVTFDPSAITPVSCATNTCDGGAIANAFGGTAGTGLYNYTWSSADGPQPNVDDGVATQLCAGWNYVSIDDFVCSIEDSIFIDAPAQISVSNDPGSITMVSCFGESDGAATITAIGGTPGYTYQWLNPMVAGQTITGVAAGIYPLNIVDANDCSFTLNVEINQPDPFRVLVDSLAVDMVNCSGGDDGEITVMTEGGNQGTITYDWSAPAVSDSLTAVGLSAGTYSITATDPKGCTDDVTYTFVEPEPIIFDIGEITPPLCFGFQTVITIDTSFGGNGPTYQFSVDGGPKRPINAAIPILGGMDHDIIVFDNENCPSMTETVNVPQPAPVQVSLPDDYEIQLGDSTVIESFIGSLLPIDSVSWEPVAGFQCDDVPCFDILVMPQEETLYELTVYDTAGCSGTDQIIIDVDKNRNVYVPNVFTPNGDGSNDTFKPFVGPGVDMINSFQVFDRWGEVVYEEIETPFFPNNDTSTGGWDGRFKGKTMNPGVYVYLIEVSFVDGLVLLYRGDVTLLH